MGSEGGMFLVQFGCQLISVPSICSEDTPLFETSLLNETMGSWR